MREPNTVGTFPHGACRLLGKHVLIFAVIILVTVQFGFAKDYVLTIGGGYAPQGNQASLEANVLFFQEVLNQRPSIPPEHAIYFADGNEPQDDLQILSPRPKPTSPAIELLNLAFDLNRDQISYRNHRVPSVQGAISPNEVRKGLRDIVSRLSDGDRLIVYVTAHGSAATGKDKMDTSIACWNQRKIQMKEFAKWLDEVPTNVPVVMIMAQCYCGGFVNTMFDQGDSDGELSARVRVGFFAQRHDLPAAGCRPDIENDEEYSSYFWGAFAGKLRTGAAISNIDCNADGRVSFAEAHAFAVRESPTIDIPLRTSEEFLRRYSRIAEYHTSPLGDEEESSDEVLHEGLAYLAGTIEEIAMQGSPERKQCVLGLCDTLGLDKHQTSSAVFEEQEKTETELRQSRFRPGRGASRGQRGQRGARRRDFKQELVAKWPELNDPSRWESLEMLQAEHCEEFLAEVKLLVHYEPFQQSIAQRAQSRTQATDAELKQVRLRRLIYTLESIVLAKNLPQVASAELLEKYRDIVAVEESSLNP